MQCLWAKFDQKGEEEAMKLKPFLFRELNRIGVPQSMGKGQGRSYELNTAGMTKEQVENLYKTYCQKYTDRVVGKSHGRFCWRQFIAYLKKYGLDCFTDLDIREMVRARRRGYYHANREMAMIRAKNWCDKNPEKAKMYRHKYYLKKRLRMSSKRLLDPKITPYEEDKYRRDIERISKALLEGQ